MKSQDVSPLLYVMLNDMGIRCCTNTSRDRKTIAARVEQEGFSFLTITLTNFCKDFERSLEQEFVDSSAFLGFKKTGKLPRLFSGFSSLVFDPFSGRLVEHPSIDAIHAIRQLCLFAGKIGLPCSDARVSKAILKYVNCDNEVAANDASLTSANLADFRRISSLLFDTVLSPIDRDVYWGTIVPKHGPGSTAEKLLGNKKYNQLEWTERLEEYFPHSEFIFPSQSHFINGPDVTLLEPGEERPVRVVTVPKTLKTPRIIAIEPTCMQYVQQGLMERIVDGIERNDTLSPMIGFEDQTPNQRMAQEGSLYGELATLDLSEASDRVSNLLVMNLFRYYAHLNNGIQACRSTKADVPGHGIIPLAKFASMGSALCFPVEAMVFLTVIFIGIEKELKRPLTREDFTSFHGKVRVYGDDIIVPVDYVRSVIEALEVFGLRVNLDKSFWNGSFRESCGKEYYAGSDVSIVRARALLPTKRKHVTEIISTVSLRNQMYFSGLWGVCSVLDELIKEFIPFPLVSETSQGLGRHSYLPVQGEKECSKLQLPLVKAAVVVAKIPSSKLEDYGALLKFFLKRGTEPAADEKHLERAGRPSRVNINTRWIPA